MKRKTLLGKRILSFLLTFVLIFSQSGFVSLAEGENEAEAVDEISEDWTDERDSNLSENDLNNDEDIIIDEEIDDSVTGEEIVEYAARFIGYPYKWGTAGPNTFDCSGLVKYVYAHFGVNLPHGTDYFAGNGYASYGTKVSGTGSLQKGDLVFFGSSDNNLSHVGIYSGDGVMINALNPEKGVVYTTISHFTGGSFRYGVRIKGVGGGTTPTPTPSSFWPLVDGTRYFIRSALSGHCIEVPSGTTKQGQPLSVWSVTGGGDRWQSWIVRKKSNGYLFENASTGQAIDIADGSKDDAVTIWQYPVNNSAAQIFTLTDGDTKGKCGIINVNSGKAIDLYNSNKSEGAVIKQCTYHGRDNQMWYFIPADKGIELTGISNGATVSGKAKFSARRFEADTNHYLRIYIDDVLDQALYSGSGGSYSFEIDTTKYSNGNHTLKAYYANTCAAWSDTKTIKIDNPVYVSGITISPSSTEVTAGKTVTLSATIAPTNATNKAITWSSSDTTVATVDQKGVVTGVKAGKATITAKAQDAGGKSATATITVKDATIAVTGVTLNKTSTTLEIGKTETLTATVTPGNASNKSVSWSSSKESVAIVDSTGVVTAKSAGTSVITVETADGGYKASCTVTVNAESTDSAKVSVANVSGTAGSKVEVPVSISNNPGIAAAGLVLSYDKTDLTLSEIKAGKVFSSGTFDAKTSTGVVQWYYAGEEDVIKTNGELFRAVFTINSSAAKGSYDVSVGLLNDDNANFTDQNGTAIPVSFAAGKVSVGMGVKGDLTGDGNVAMGDVVKVARAVAGYIILSAEEEALADVTGDGKVAMGDVVKIARFVAGYIDSLITTSNVQSLNYSVSGITVDISDGEDMIVMAGEDAAVTVAEKKAKAGDTVEIPVEIKTNPGIASAALSVSYDAASLELKSITKGEVFSEGTFTGDVEKNLVQWYDVSTNKDTTATGKIFTMEFAVKSTAKAGNYAIKVGYLDNDEANVTNINSENVKVVFTDGAIVIEGEGGSENEDPEPVPAGIAEVEVGKARAEAGKTVEIPVEIKTNPGIASAALSVSYDAAALELNTITKGDVFSNGTFTGDVAKNLIQWYDVSSNKDTTATGTLFTLGFSVKDDAKAGKYAVKLGCLEDNEANVTNINSESVSVNFVDGEVEVESAKTEPVPAGTAEIEAGKAQTNPGKTVEIPVEIKTNPGIAGLSLSISYNNAALTLKSINKGKVLTAGTFTGDTDKNLIQWYDVSSNKNTTDTGVIFTLGFEVRSNAAEGAYAVTVGLLNDEPSNATNIDSENVPVKFTAGEVKVVSGTIDPPAPVVEKEDPFCIAPDVTADTTELYLVKGQKFTMPEAGWTSSNKKQVTVSKKGVVNAKKVTTTPVTLTKGDRTIKVYVTKPAIDKKLTITDGEVHKINLTYDAEHLDVYWFSSDPNVADVNMYGEVEPIANGTATITAFINSKAYKCKVKVVETEPFNYRYVYMTEGSTKTLKIKGLKNPMWESDDTSIVTVEKNKITGVSTGSAMLTTTYENEIYRVYVSVEDITPDIRGIVKKGKNKYTISLDVDDYRGLYMDIRQDVVFISNKSEIAYIDSTGYLIARKAGKAKLTAKLNGKTVTINVTVNN